jgi:hypothetical protein
LPILSSLPSPDHPITFQLALSIFWLVLAFPTTFGEPVAVSLKTDDITYPYIGVQLFVGFMYFAAFISDMSRDPTVVPDD